MGLIPAPRSRAEMKEILDNPDCERQALFANLKDIQKFNKLLGTRNAVLNHVKNIAGKNYTGKLKILDICTGSADIPVFITDWARKNKITAEITAIDINPDIISFARQETENYPEIKTVIADAFKLPYEKGKFHITICSQAFHHFSDNDCIRLIQVMDNFSEYGFVVNDLRRDWLNYYGAKLLGSIWNLNYITRNDAPVSVLRAFTKPEFEKLAEISGVKSISCYSYFMHSLQLVCVRKQS